MAFELNAITNPNTRTRFNDMKRRKEECVRLMQKFDKEITKLQHNSC